MAHAGAATGATGGPPAPRILALEASFYNPPNFRQIINRYPAETPGVELKWWPLGGKLPQGTTWAIQHAAGETPPKVFFDIMAALRALNFDPQTLLPGLYPGYVSGGRVFGLPYTLSPWGVVYNKAAATAAGVAVSRPWSLSDFEHACVLLQSWVTREGRATVIGSVLPPLVGQWQVPHSYTWPGVFAGSPRLWMAFVAGFGGSPFGDGGFDVTGDAAMQAFVTLGDWQRRFGAPLDPSPRTWKLANQIHQATALQFGFPWSVGYTGANGFMPFPALPARQPVPVVSSGVSLWAEEPPPAAQLQLAVSFMLWLLRPAQQAALGTAGNPPVLADPLAQAAFWNAGIASYPPVVGPATAGLWKRFVDPLAGIPPGAPVGKVGAALAQYGAGDLQDLRSALRQAEDDLNAWWAGQQAAAPAGA